MTYDEALAYLSREGSDYQQETMDAISSIVAENDRLSGEIADMSSRYSALESSYRDRWRESIPSAVVNDKTVAKNVDSEDYKFSDLYKKYKEEK